MNKAAINSIEPGTMRINDRPLGSTIQWYDGRGWRVLWGHGTPDAAQRAAQEFGAFRAGTASHMLKSFIVMLRALVDRDEGIDNLSRERVFELIGQTLDCLMKTEAEANEPKPTIHRP